MAENETKPRIASIDGYVKEDLGPLYEDRILGNFHVEQLKDTIKRAKEEADPAEKYEMQSKAWQQARQALAYDVGIKKKPELNMQGAVAYGMEEIEKYIKIGKA
ncbi:MAG: hypothetical protein ABIB71_03200 [Candidatus Woesearchaeota archaeon]